MSTGDIIVLAVVLVLVAGAIFSLVRSHRSGKCSCGCEDCCNNCCSSVLKIEDGKN